MYLSSSPAGGNTRTKAVMSVVEERSRPPYRNVPIRSVVTYQYFLKVRLLKDVSENEAEDGYSLVDEFLSYHPNVLDKIKEKAKNSYCEHLIDKYSDRFSLWIFVEVLSFGDFINLCDYYYGKYPARDIKIGTVRIVKFIRNAAAHNNCLINNLKDNSSGSFTQNREANRIVASIDGISEKVRAKKMGNRTVHDFIVLLYRLWTTAELIEAYAAEASRISRADAELTKSLIRKELKRRFNATLRLLDDEQTDENPIIE